jgi:transporter family-2 protein
MMALILVAIVTGQMLASVALDHFGWVGFPQHSATLPRLVGAVFVVVGVALIRK